MSLLEITGLEKQYPSILAVDDVSFDIEEGEFVTILGPSGSGKSTILRMIAGFEEPTGGTIRLGGEDVTTNPPFERDTNMMFQDLALFPHLTVAENIEYGLKQKGVPKPEREDRITDILETVELSEYGDRDPSELSGGEQQRVALARAIVNQPKLMLFDEPLASLDRKLRQHMQLELQRIQEETGITCLYVTHDQEVAMSISDRMVLLNEGAIEQEGAVEELYDQPQSQFVANFIGDVNTLSATVREVTDERVVLQTDGAGTEFTLASDTYHATVPLDAGTDVEFCVRPRDIDLAPASRKNGDQVGTVANRSYQGGETTYMVDFDGTTLTVLSDSGDIEQGTPVAVGWAESDVYVFPGRTEGT